MSVKIGIAGASTMAHEGREAFLRYVDTLEAQGWDSLWFSDRIVGPVWRMDPIAGMAMVAARTSKLKFGTGVLLMSMRSPVATARALATIDYIAGGRLIVGVGVGQESTSEYDAMGIQKRERGRRLDEAIMLMRRLWTEDRVTYESPFLRLTDASIHPKPAQRNVPIWIGSRAEAGLKRTGYLADGWLPTQMTPSEIADGIQRIKRYAAEAGRTIPNDHFGLQITTYVVERGNVPMDKVAPYLLHRRSDVGPEQINLLGTADQIIERLKTFVDAGATKFVFNPACGADEMEDQVAIQAEAVVRPIHDKQLVLA